MIYWTRCINCNNFLGFYIADPHCHKCKLTYYSTGWIYKSFPDYDYYHIIWDTGERKCFIMDKYKFLIPIPYVEYSSDADLIKFYLTFS